jgi:drug/metabolite transporter (DMT)-like permease
MTSDSPSFSSHAADAQSWALLVALSLVWGGSFMFIGFAVKELPALLIVLARVAMAASILLPIHWIMVGALPRDRNTWIATLGMSVMNNAIPFTLISWGQHHITSGLASVVNATTPAFAVVFMAMAGLEAMTLRKVVALVIGIIGVAILKGGNFGDLSAQTLGIWAVIIASAFYGLSSPWSKRRLVGIPPLTTATCQLLGSTVIMAIIVAFFAEPSRYADVSMQTWLALLGLASLSTAFAYLLFFRIIARAGPSFVSLVTMIIPVSAIALGYFALNEKLNSNEIVGALVIGLALIIIDGRLLKRVGINLA